MRLRSSGQIVRCREVSQGRGAWAVGNGAFDIVDLGGKMVSHRRKG